MKNKIYLDNPIFMELIDELASQITEMNYGAETYINVRDGLSDGTVTIFTEEAQDYYNEKYDDYEGILNRFNIYRDEK